jgi:hypothetical protein
MDLLFLPKKDGCKAGIIDSMFLSVILAEFRTRLENVPGKKDNNDQVIN